MKATKDTISNDEQIAEIQVEQDSGLNNEPENEVSEENYDHSAPVRTTASSMGACPSSNSNNISRNNITLLQQSYGNLATLRLLNQNLAVQPTLKISRPKDHFEQEADYIADLITGNSGMERQKKPG